jgi:hypothetical protein
MEEKKPPTKIDWAARRKRRKLAWGDLPTFLDASASVSASIFGARRLPELKSLYQEQQQQASKVKATADPPEQCFLSSGGKTSARHLRRRITSMHRRIRHRFPTGRKPTIQSSMTREDELEGDATTATTATTTTAEKVKSTTRRARRNNRAILCSEHFGWQRTPTEEHMNKDTTTANHSNNNNVIHYWMTTHLWHTKRFHIDSLWGWKVPLVHNNRGARASLRLSQTKAWVQDVSWRTQPIDVRSTSFPLLLQAMSRICPNIAQSKAVLSGSQVGQGVVHHVDQFPNGAIGPASWRIFPQKNAAGSIKAEWVFQLLGVHPSIRSTILECLGTLSKQHAELTIVGQVNGGRSCLQLRGVNATETLRKVLAPKATDALQSWEWNWKWTTVGDDQASGSDTLPRGAIFSVQVDLTASTTDTGNEIPAPATWSNPEAAAKHVKSVQDAISNWDPSRPEYDEHSSLGDAITKDTVLLIFQKPREPDHNCVANQAICGWDIICSPDLAKDIWNLLVVVNEVFPIGIVEEAQLMLECQPPVPLFPRDYVDTEESKKYWSGTDPDWKRVRQLWQGGWGRLPVDKEPAAWSPLSFNDLILIPEVVATKDDTDTDETKPDSEPLEQRVVVVRGAFGQPFCDALGGCAKMAPTPDDQSSKPKPPTRRKRRRTRHPTQLVSAMPLSNDQAQEFTETCRLLQTSLTLPAVLLCHVQVSGPGTILPGARLLFRNNGDGDDKPTSLVPSSAPLGIVTAGGFSPARGSCHGVGIVGAARLLEVLASAAVGEEKQKRGAVIVRNLNGTRDIQLLVTIKDGTSEYSGTLSLPTKE